MSPATASTSRPPDRSRCGRCGVLAVRIDDDIRASASVSAMPRPAAVKRATFPSSFMWTCSDVRRHRSAWWEVSLGTHHRVDDAPFHRFHGGFEQGRQHEVRPQVQAQSSCVARRTSLRRRTAAHATGTVKARQARVPAGLRSSLHVRRPIRARLFAIGGTVRSASPFAGANCSDG